MGLKSFLNNWLKQSYRFGKTFTDQINDGRDQKTTGVVDAVLGVAATWFFGAQVLNWTLAAVGAVATAIALPAAIPSALGTLAGAVIFGGLGVFATAAGLGFLRSANNKLNIVKLPYNIPAEIKYNAAKAKNEIAKPFKLAGAKLSSVFNKAHVRRNNAVPAPLQVLKPAKISGDYEL